MVKEYRYYCRRCGGYYSTQTRIQSLCRGCLAHTGISIPLAYEMFGKPILTELELKKVKFTLKMMGLLKEDDTSDRESEED